MKTHLLLPLFLIATIQSATAALVTRNVNLSFVFYDINIDVDNDGLNEFSIDLNQEYALPLSVPGPPCEYSDYHVQTLFMTSLTNAAPGPHYGTVTNDISNIPGITGMVQVPTGYIAPGTYGHIRLGYHHEINPISGSCASSSPYLENYTGFLADTTTTTNTYFAFNVRFADGTYHFGYIEFNGYHITKLVYDDVANVLAGVSLVEAGENMSIGNDNGNIVISTTEMINHVLVSDLNGRTEEFNSATFHTSKKGWVVVQITTTSGVVDRRRIFIQ